VRSFLVVLAVALPLHADGLSDVRAALAKLSGRDPIRATYEVQRQIDNNGKFNNDKFTGRASIDVEGDANGVRVQFSRALLEQMEKEQDAKAREPKKPTPTVSAVAQMGALAVADAIDHAPYLLHMLDDAKLVEDRAGTLGGKPSRVIIFRLADKRDMDIGKMTVIENKLTLWLGDDHVPVAAELVRAAKYSFLIFKAEWKTNRSWHFARIGDRLVRMRDEEREIGSGLGQKGNTLTIATLKVR
jgi:hypothetical protein